MEGVLDVGSRVRRVEQPLRIGVVLGEQQRRRAVAVEPAIAERPDDDAAMTLAPSDVSAAAEMRLRVPGHQFQVLRNHSVGSRCSGRCLRARDW